MRMYYLYALPTGPLSRYNLVGCVDGAPNDNKSTFIVTAMHKQFRNDPDHKTLLSLQ